MGYELEKKQKILIGWPLTPFTGWGSYGIQIAQELISKQIGQPIVAHKIQRTNNCDLHWKIWADQIELASEQIIKTKKNNENMMWDTNCRVIFEGLGNGIRQHEYNGMYRVGVTFFERSDVPVEMQSHIKDFDLIITGSNWNQKILEESACTNSILIHQGVDLSKFNSIEVPRLIKRPIIIFSGGKLEARKGQDIIVEAFKRFLRYCPDALLIACWSNVGDIGINTMITTPYISNNPKSGKASDIHNWLMAQGIPAENVVVPTAITNSQLPNLIKQSDVAVFASRCEGGTNLMAMETLACGIPTILSDNTGHKDLLNTEIQHTLELKKQSRVSREVTDIYGGDLGNQWGESSPEEIEYLLKVFLDEKESWKNKGIKSSEAMKKWSWKESMNKLTNSLKERKIIL